MSNFGLTPILLVLSLGISIFVISFVSKRKHLLATLLSLEGVMLMLFGVILYLSVTYFTFTNFALIFLTLTACEGALGLGLLVVIIRTHGGDYFNSMNSLQC